MKYLLAIAVMIPVNLVLMQTGLQLGYFPAAFIVTVIFNFGIWHLVLP